MKKKAKIDGSADILIPTPICLVLPFPKEDSVPKELSEEEKKKQEQRDLEDFEESYQEAKEWANQVMEENPYTFNNEGIIEGDETEKTTKMLTSFLMRAKKKRRDKELEQGDDSGPFL